METNGAIADKLQAIIKEKKDYLPKVTNEYAKRIRHDEIIFLERDVLPLVLAGSSMLYWDVLKRVTTKLQQAIDMKCDGIFMFIPFHDKMGDDYVIGVDNPRSEQGGNMDSDFVEILVDRIGMDGKICRPVNLPL